MASKKTVTPDNLVALGPERLAAILIELADRDAEVKRRLRLELAAQAGGDTIAAEIGKRLAALRSARSFVDWQQRRDFVKDLDLQRAMIVDRVAQTRADLALDLMWRFMDLAAPVLNRVDDSNGSVGDVFRAACEDLGTMAAKAKPNPVNLADRVLAAMQANDYGVFDGLVAVMLPTLGEAGAAHLKERLRKVLADRSGKAGERDYHARVVRSALQALADGQSNVDAYIALVPPEERRMPHQGARSAAAFSPPAGRPRRLPRWNGQGRSGAPPRPRATTTSTSSASPPTTSGKRPTSRRSRRRAGRTRPNGCAGRHSRSGSRPTSCAPT
jgi:hypothetical protein